MHVRGAPAMTCQCHVEAVGDGPNLHPFRDASGPAIVRLYHIGALTLPQVEELILRIKIFSGRDPYIERMSHLGKSLHLVRRKRLFQPETAEILVDPATANRFIRVEYLIGIHHNAARFST